MSEGGSGFSVVCLNGRAPLNKSFLPLVLHSCPLPLADKHLNRKPHQNVIRFPGGAKSEEVSLYMVAS